MSALGLVLFQICAHPRGVERECCLWFNSYQWWQMLGLLFQNVLVSFHQFGHKYSWNNAPCMLQLLKLQFSGNCFHWAHWAQIQLFPFSLAKTICLLLVLAWSNKIQTHKLEEEKIWATQPASEKFDCVAGMPKFRVSVQKYYGETRKVGRSATDRCWI